MRLLFLPFEISLRVLVYIVLGIAALSVLVGSQNAGGEAAHLGGIAVGFVLVKFPRLLGFVPNEWTWPRRDPRNTWMKKQLKAEEDERRLQGEVDRILDKVREHGLHKLSRAEKKILQRATERQRRAG
jgi:hypothetical protein